MGPGDDPRIGRTIDGRYLIRAQLGRGGMGMVYAADHVGLDRRVAIKFVVKDGVPDSALARFRREARLAGRVDHPNVVRIYDVGVDDGDDYIAMEYVDGRDLDAVIRDGGPLPPERAIAITSALLAGLHAIHAQGIIHRDIKPSNVRLMAGDVVKLMDFGIARAFDDLKLTRTNQAPGTPLFMAPEQLRGTTVDHRADLYAVGVTLFMMLTGDPPFSGATAEVAAKHVYEPPPPLPATVPPVLARVVARALSKSPADRFADAPAFAAALAGRVAVEPEPEAAATIGARPPRRRRAPVWPWLLVAGLVGAAAGIWFLAMRGDRGEVIAHVTADAPAATDSAVVETTAIDAVVEVTASDAAVEVTAQSVATDARSVDGRGPRADAAVRPATRQGPSHGCQCIPSDATDVVALCPTKGPLACRCDLPSGRSLCLTPLAACRDTYELEAVAKQLGKSLEQVCQASPILGEGAIGCPDHLYDRFAHTGVTHGEPCSGYLVYALIDNSRDTAVHKGKWYCDVCSDVNTRSYTGTTGDRCEGFYWHTGERLTGTLQHCD